MERDEATKMVQDFGSACRRDGYMLARGRMNGERYDGSNFRIVIERALALIDALTTTHGELLRTKAFCEDQESSLPLGGVLPPIGGVKDAHTDPPCPCRFAGLCAILDEACESFDGSGFRLGCSGEDPKICSLPESLLETIRTVAHVDSATCFGTGCDPEGADVDAPQDEICECAACQPAAGADHPPEHVDVFSRCILPSDQMCLSDSCSYMSKEDLDGVWSPAAYHGPISEEECGILQGSGLCMIDEIKRSDRGDPPREEYIPEEDTKTEGEKTWDGWGAYKWVSSGDPRTAVVEEPDEEMCQCTACQPAAGVDHPPEHVNVFSRCVPPSENMCLSYSCLHMSKEDLDGAWSSTAYRGPVSAEACEALRDSGLCMIDEIKQGMREAEEPHGERITEEQEALMDRAFRLTRPTAEEFIEGFTKADIAVRQGMRGEAVDSLGRLVDEYIPPEASWAMIERNDDGDVVQVRILPL